MKKYLHTTRKRFDPLALGISTVGLLAVLFVVGGLQSIDYFLDLKSFLIVFGGTAASLLFQFDFSSLVHGALLIVRSFLGTPEKKILAVIRQLDDAIINDLTLQDLREGSELTGELLGDIVYMHNQGLLFEEIDAFVTSRIADEFLGRQVAVTMLSRAAMIAPSLGLFGTVIGLLGVLRSLSDPSHIGPSMSLALITTAYGAGLGSLVFTPLSGRLEHHNTVFLEVYKQLMSKVGILLSREDRKLDRTFTPEAKAG